MSKEQLTAFGEQMFADCKTPFERLALAEAIQTEGYCFDLPPVAHPWKFHEGQEVIIGKENLWHKLRRKIRRLFLKRPLPAPPEE